VLRRQSFGGHSLAAIVFLAVAPVVGGGVPDRTGRLPTMSRPDPAVGY
jgi:hypothetical protein